MYACMHVCMTKTFDYLLCITEKEETIHTKYSRVPLPSSDHALFYKDFTTVSVVPNVFYYTIDNNTNNSVAENHNLRRPC